MIEKSDRLHLFPSLIKMIKEKKICSAPSVSTAEVADSCDSLNLCIFFHLFSKILVASSLLFFLLFFSLYNAKQNQRVFVPFHWVALRQLPFRVYEPILCRSSF